MPDITASIEPVLAPVDAPAWTSAPPSAPPPSLAPPPEAPRLETVDVEGTALVRDEQGIARGGIRTPWVEAPSAVLSGDPPGGEGFLFLFGKTVALDQAALAELYPGGPDEHYKRFEAATARALREGFLLEADADEIRDFARHGRQPSGWRGE